MTFIHSSVTSSIITPHFPLPMARTYLTSRYSLLLWIFIVSFHHVSIAYTTNSSSSSPSRHFQQTILQTFSKHRPIRHNIYTTPNKPLHVKHIDGLGDDNPRRKNGNSQSKLLKQQQQKQKQQPSFQRGSNYGKEHNSTIPQPSDVAKKLGVKPTKETSTKEWQKAWKFLKSILPILHAFDSCKPPDSSLNLACMWWKALSGNDKLSPVYDNGLSYDILPSGFRWLVHKRLCRFYPRLHHANVELRTAFLDRAIKNIIDSDVRKGKKIRLICLGAGYDLRSIKLLERKLVDQAFELDLEQVVDAKKKLIGEKRLLSRRPWLRNIRMPKLIPSDLNNIEKVRLQLKEIISDEDDVDDYHTIFVFEGVMIYLDDGVPSSLLNITSDVLRECKANGSLCFADRLENIPGGDFELGMKELNRNGWKIEDWCPKPGLARHMGFASMLTSYT